MSRRLAALWLVLALGAPAIVLLLPGDRLPSGWERHPSLSTPVHVLWQHPADSQVVLAGSGRQIVGGTSAGGLLRSQDSGRHWESSSQGLPEGSEVTALAGGKGIFGDSFTLLAGTFSHGVFLSNDGGRNWQSPRSNGSNFDWSLVQIRALVVLPGDPAAIAVATDGLGILVSEDGGGTWEARNQSLPSLNPQNLAIEGDELIAGLWFGGIHRSRDRGRTWNPYSTNWDEKAVSAMMLAKGRFWIGTQDGRLLAATPGREGKVEAVVDLEDAAITAIDIDSKRLAISTDCLGPALGEIDGSLQLRSDGLDTLNGTAILIDRADPARILLGTSSGLYLAKPPPPPPFWLAGLALLSVLLAAELTRRWQRSIYSKMLKAYRELKAPTAGPAVEILWAKLSHQVPHRELSPFFQGLAKRLRYSRDPVRQSLAEVVQLGSNFGGEMGLLRNNQLDAKARHANALILLRRSHLLEELAAKETLKPDFLRLLALQDRLFAAIYQASNLSHLGSFADQVELFIDEIRQEPPTRALMDPQAATILAKVTQLHSQLTRLPPEDRSLLLGRMLSEILVGIDSLKSTRHGHIGGLVVLEILRQILLATLRDLRERAEIHLVLQTRALPSGRESLVVVDLRNSGQGHADNLVVQLKESPGIRAITHTQHLRCLLKQQTARLEFLVEHQRGDRARLTFQLRWDDLEMVGHQAEFADVVELRSDSVEPAATFRPLRPNPYVVGRPLRESDVFIGREDTFDRITTSLEGANQDNVVVLMGQRRMGKTSVLRQLGRHIGTKYAPVLVDLQGILARNQAAFLWEIAAAICDGLESLGISVEVPSSLSFSDDAGFFFRHRFLKQVCQSLGERKLLIAFDELEVLAERIAAGDLSPGILPYLRSLMQHEEKISFLFAGTHRLEQLTGDYWGALFNLAVYLEIGHLRRDEVGELFLRPTRDAFEIDPLALDKAARVTGGHPHFSQLVARELVELRNEDALDYITIQDLNRVTRRVVQKGQMHIAYLWNEASHDEKLLLLAIDQLLAVEGGATLADARKLIESRHKQSKNNDFALALRALLRKELLEEKGGRLEMRIELLRSWMELNRNLVDEVWS